MLPAIGEERVSEPGFMIPRSELCLDPYLIPSYPHEHSRLWSTHRTGEGSRKCPHLDSRGGLVEKRDYDRPLNHDHSYQHCSSSPLISQVRGRHVSDDDRITHQNRSSPPLELRGMYGLTDSMDNLADRTHRNGDRITLQTNLGVDFVGSKYPTDGALLNQNSISREVNPDQESFRTKPDLVQYSNYRENDIHEIIEYKVSLDPQRLSGSKEFLKAKEAMFNMRGRAVSESQSRLMKTGNLSFRDFGCTSRKFGDELSGSNQERISVDGIPSGLVTEASHSHECFQRSLQECARDPEDGQKDLPSYPKPYLELGKGELGYYGFSYDVSSGNFLPRAQRDDQYRNLVELPSMDPYSRKMDFTEVSYRSPRDRIDQIKLEGDSVINHIDMSRMTYPSNNIMECLGSDSRYSDFGGEMSRDVLRDEEGSCLRLGHDYRRHEDIHNERSGGAFMPNHDLEMHEFSMSQQPYGEKLGSSHLPDRLHKRKASVGEDMNRRDVRGFKSGKYRRNYDHDDRGDEWNDVDFRGLHLSREADFDCSQYMEDGLFDAKNHYGHSSDRLSYHDPLKHLQSRSHKRGSRYLKGQLLDRPALFNKSDPQSRPNVWKRIKDEDKVDPTKRPNVWTRRKDSQPANVHEQGVDSSGVQMASAKSEPPEDSEEFKKLVHDYFLKWSRKLYGNPAIRRKYKEQGEVGSLFCIVCDKSLSKEFKQTQYVATHAFMSQKQGSRAQHLGFHKAICVLMGWDSTITGNGKTWVPQALSKADALAEKEDLIFWPPLVIIRNSSMSKANKKDEKVISVEVLETFLRGKGFSRARLKVCLGTPANHSIMVVKFPATYSGVLDAERLHIYFAETKRGRKEFTELVSRKSKMSAGGKGPNVNDSVEGIHLYGYTGTVEDLDEVDHGSKNLCTLRSKKEIQDLVDAPVKPE